jgi:hypothetical protein
VRWVTPAAVIVTGIGLLTLYVPLGKGMEFLIPPFSPIALTVLGTIGLVVGLVGAWRKRIEPIRAVSGSQRLADSTALAGLVVAVTALLAISSIYVVEPILVSLQGPDPCGGRFDTACFMAHPDYWQHEAVADSWAPPSARLSQTLLPVAWPAGLGLALAAALVSWLALATGTRRRRVALSALTLGVLVLLFMLVPWFGLLLGGGGD